MFAADLMQTKERRELVIAIFLLAAVSLLGLFLDNVVLVVVPIVALLAYISLRDIRLPYFFLFAMIPISWEQELGGGFGTDLPTEPMMVILMGLAFIYLLRRGKYINAQAILHPITLFLLLHYAWIWASSIWSEQVFVSIKWSLAKTWYISVFFLLSMFLLRSRAQIQTLIKIVLWPLVIVTIIILIRHAQKDFSFESANFVMAPFFRNHVTSAALMSLLVPFCVLLFMNTKHFLMRVLYVLAFIILILGAYFSYTRAAHISLVLSLMIIPIVKYRLVKHTLIVAAIAMVWLTTNIISENKYLGLAPDFETTVSHTTFDDLVNATYQGKDISTMERIYRWVAGYQMIQKNPWLGFGPGNFYNFYKSYTLTLFKTYVSDNPEKSGIHCYYLMILTEQGFIGLAIFLMMVAVVLISMESVYHRLKDPVDRRILLTFMVSFFIILLFQLINDLIETDKMGPFFFLAMAITVIYDLKSRGEEVINISE